VAITRARGMMEDNGTHRKNQQLKEMNFKIPEAFRREIEEYLLVLKLEDYNKYVG
jgi:hypothetical protein